jgi:hypothetical protein
MAFKSFRKIRTDDQGLMRLQDSIADSIAPLLKAPLVDGNLVSLTLSVGINTVPHGLSRPPIGFKIVRQNAQANFWEPAPSEFIEKALLIQSTANVTVTIFFF